MGGFGPTLNASARLGLDWALISKVELGLEMPPPSPWTTHACRLSGSSPMLLLTSCCSSSLYLKDQGAHLPNSTVRPSFSLLHIFPRFRVRLTCENPLRDRKFGRYKMRTKFFFMENRTLPNIVEKWKHVLSQGMNNLMFSLENMRTITLCFFLEVQSKGVYIGWFVTTRRLDFNHKCIAQGAKNFTFHWSHERCHWGEIFLTNIWYPYVYLGVSAGPRTGPGTLFMSTAGFGSLIKTWL